jgi:hypothetical protein
MKVKRGVDAQLYSFFNLAIRWGWMFNYTPRPPYLRERQLVPILRWLAGLQNWVSAGAENIAPIEI